MAFRFTTEDFNRYVSKKEHEGRHIWADLQEQLETFYGIPFSATPFVRRGDWLQTLWFAPKDTPRSIWSNQAQFFLVRSIEEKHLKFGLMVECASQAEVTEYELDPDLDGMRLIEQLENNTNFASLINLLASQEDWGIEVNEWNKNTYFPRDSSELLALLKKMSRQQGWGVHIQCTLRAARVLAAGEEIAARIMDTYRGVRPIWEAVIPENVGQFLASGVVAPVASPQTRDNGQTQSPPPPFDLRSILTRSLTAKGLAFTSWQIATFYTALQTKGFVILSGISGTGKTKLAQHFAALLPQPHNAAMPHPINIALVGAADPIEDQRKYGSGKPFAYWWSYPIRDDVEAALVTPFHVYIYYQGQITHVQTVAEFQTRTGDQGLESPWLDITLPEESHKIGPDVHSDLKFKTWCKVTDVTKLNRPIELSTVHTLFGYKNHPSALRNALVPIEDPQIEPKSGTNWLFVPVRPDWRDSKSLLGYFNPLTGTYEWTPFLRFLLRAAQSYRDGDGLAWFIILDEMNLAHVEYYFADLLSVLESGREKDSWTREPLRLLYPDEAEGDLPPRELRLPPNLYIVGTVNVDETTHTFSPKVLDRAFTLELTEADFSTYLTQPPEENVELDDRERRTLLRDFTFDGEFTGCGYVDKQYIAKYLSNHPQVRTRLQTLNDLLRPYDLHFGYRVFDEILWFLDAAEYNKLFADLGDYEAALDAAVLMKVLPKFHGSRGKLEAPLRAVLAWCIDPDAPAQDAITDALRQIEAGDDVGDVLSRITFRYPVTAERARRMLRALYTDGFAAFG